MKYKLVIFDLDGTLLDTTEGILMSVKHTIKSFSLPMLTDDELRTFIGPPIQLSLNKYYGLEGDKLQEMTDCFRAEYSTKHLLKAAPYEGIFQLMENLSANGIRCAVATYKREDYALKLLNHYGFNGYMDIMYGADNENKLKKKDIIIKCIESSGITDYRDVVMIGDTTHDSSGAFELGIDFIGVTYGFGFRKEDRNNHSFTGMADNPGEILNLIIKE